MGRYCCDHKCDQGRDLCARRIAARRLDAAESAARALLISEPKQAPESLPALLLRKGTLIHAQPEPRVSRLTVAARRTYRVLWVAAQTLALLLRADAPKDHK
jgi:hypothetical protein